jgi:hypothetical protein
MPLPRSIGYLDNKGFQKRAPLKEAKRPSGYKPTADYHPTHVVVKCRTCRSVGIAEFEGGFDLKKGDRLMDGKPISGHCFRCAKETELVPIGPDHPDNTPHLRHLFNIRKALEEAARRGESVGSSGVVWPLERVKMYERYVAGRR